MTPRREFLTRFHQLHASAWGQQLCWTARPLQSSDCAANGSYPFLLVDKILECVPGEYAVVSYPCRPVNACMLYIAKQPSSTRVNLYIVYLVYKMSTGRLPSMVFTIVIRLSVPCRTADAAICCRRFQAANTSCNHTLAATTASAACRLDMKHLLHNRIDSTA